MRKRAQREPVYPQGDNLPGVVFYLIESRRLPWEECKTILREIAEEFARNGPFRVRFGARREGNQYWLGLNHEECGVAFELAVDIKAYKITRSTQLPGGNPHELNVVLNSDQFRAITQGGGGMDEDWGGGAVEVPQEPKYADRHTGVVFYRLDRGEIEVAIVVETLRDIAAIMLQPMGRALPFALRQGIRQDPPSHYWVGLNSSTAGVLFERTLEELQVRVTRRPRLPGADPNPTLRLILDLPGVPILPVPKVPIAQQVPDWPVAAPLPLPLLDDEPEPVRRQRMAWARSLDVAGMTARMRARIPKRRRRPAPEESPDDEI